MKEIGLDKLGLLNALQEQTERVLGGLLLPVRMQKGDVKQEYRAPLVFKMRVPNGASAEKKAPYVLHTVITGSDKQESGELCESTAVVRSIFCAYNEDEQEGSLALLEMMERWRIDVLKTHVIADRFEIDLETDNGLESLVYPDDTAPYFIGEYVSRWKLPSINREVKQTWLREDRLNW